MNSALQLALARQNLVKKINASTVAEEDKLFTEPTKMINVENNEVDYYSELSQLLGEFIADPAKLENIIEILNEDNDEYIKNLVINWDIYKQKLLNLRGSVVSARKIIDVLENQLDIELHKKEVRKEAPINNLMTGDDLFDKQERIEDSFTDNRMIIKRMLIKILNLPNTINDKGIKRRLTNLTTNEEADIKEYFNCLKNYDKEKIIDEVIKKLRTIEKEELRFKNISDIVDDQGNPKHNFKGLYSKTDTIKDEYQRINQERVNKGLPEIEYKDMIKSNNRPENLFDSLPYSLLKNLIKDTNKELEIRNVDFAKENIKESSSKLITFEDLAYLLSTFNVCFVYSFRKVTNTELDYVRDEIHGNTMSQIKEIQDIKQRNYKDVFDANGEKIDEENILETETKKLLDKYILPRINDNSILPVNNKIFQKQKYILDLCLSLGIVEEGDEIYNNLVKKVNKAQGYQQTDIDEHRNEIKDIIKSVLPEIKKRLSKYSLVTKQPVAGYKKPSKDYHNILYMISILLFRDDNGNITNKNSDVMNDFANVIQLVGMTKTQEQNLLNELHGLVKYNSAVLNKVGHGLKKMGQVSNLRPHEKQVNNKYYVNKRLLDDHGILEIRYIKNRHKAHINPPTLSHNAKKAFSKLIDDVKISDDDYISLNQFERDLLRRINKLFGEKQSFNDDDDSKFTKQFEILRGEYLAGNNSQLVKNQLKQYIIHSVDIGKLTQHQGRKMMMDLGLI